MPNDDAAEHVPKRTTGRGYATRIGESETDAVPRRWESASTRTLSFRLPGAHFARPEMTPGPPATSLLWPPRFSSSDRWRLA